MTFGDREVVSEHYVRQGIAYRAVKVCLIPGSFQAARGRTVALSVYANKCSASGYSKWALRPSRTAAGVNPLARRIVMAGLSARAGSDGRSTLDSHRL